MLPTAVSTATTTTTTGGIGGGGGVIGPIINDMDLSTTAAAAAAAATTNHHQPMDWLFKKERIYWLAQFWQQKAILAEKEISTLKEQLTTETKDTIDSSLELNKPSIDLTTATSVKSTSPPTSQLHSHTTPSSMLSLPPNSASSILNTLPLLNGCTNNPLNGIITGTGIPSILTSNLNLNLNGNFIANAPSPSPPLSENESITSIGNLNDNNNENNIVENKINDSNCKLIEDNKENENKITENIIEKEKYHQIQVNNNHYEKEAEKCSSDGIPAPPATTLKLQNSKIEKDNEEDDVNMITNNNDEIGNKDDNRLITDNNNQVENNNCKKLELDKDLQNDEEASEQNEDVSMENTAEYEVSSIDEENKLKLLNNSTCTSKIDDFDERDEEDCEKNIEENKMDENKKENEESEEQPLQVEDKNIICDLRNNNLKEELAFKDKEIKILSDEVTRLKILYEQQILHNERLQNELEQKLNIILRLESHLNNNVSISILNNSNDTSKINESISQSSDDEVIFVKKEQSPSPLENDENLNSMISKSDINLTDVEKQFNEKIELSNSNQNRRDTFNAGYHSDDNSTSVNDSHHLHQNYVKSSLHYDSQSNPSTPNNHFYHYDGRRSTDPIILSPFSGKMDLTENAANSLQQMAAAGPFGGAHMPNPFQSGLQFAFSTQSQDRLSFSRFSDADMHLSGNGGTGGSSSTSGRYSTDLLIPKSDPMEAKLQEMLRYGLDKFANHNLDTLYISRRVRELLSVHNIGQRIFAKYVLGLSQGTVSELLSKPKPWDKLTEKGRDSYRKMHAWACDDAAILLLKSLIPKKDSNIPQFNYQDDRISEDRLSAHIRSDSSSPMLQKPTIHVSTSLGGQSFTNNQKTNQTKDEDSHSNDDLKSPNNLIRCATPSSIKDSKLTMNNSSVQEHLPRLDYHEELAKIMSRNQREVAPPFPGLLFPQIYGSNGNSSIPPNMANLELALQTYHRELAKLQNRNGTNFPNFTELLALQQHQASLALNGSVQDLSVSKEKHEIVNSDNQNNPKENVENHKDTTRDFDLSTSNQEKPTITCSSRSQTPSKGPSPMTSSILTPTSEDFPSSINPLQRMASITNSLITQPPLPPLHSQSPRPLKAVLPPITQQQFDLYNNLNTEEIVRNIKEALSQYSISQRLFGENVLGLSQGSVSDLLARPKPWHMLTQKGREPFIRMKMFLEDDSAVHKLVASQYKIAPEKLMRTGNYTGTPQIPTSLASKIDDLQNSSMQKIINDLKLKQESQQQHLMQQMRAANALANLPATQHQAAAGMLLTPPGLIPHYSMPQPSAPVTNSNNNNNMDGNPGLDKKSPMPIIPISSPQPGNVMRNGQSQHMSPTVYEMAALTQDLDTQIITTKVKEVLLANNIGQKIFGEAVLGLSQGSVSELLSKPKPWHMLSIKGREPFIRMQLWLSDMNNVERLQTLKNEQREASKRRRSIGPGGSHDNSDTSSNDTNDFYTTSPGPGSVGSNGVPPNKKQRVLFSEEQKEALRLAFTLDPYPNVTTIEFLANELGLATRTITNWFHNHRMRLKQQMPHGQPAEPIPTRENQTGPPLDPVQFKILLNQRLMEMQKDRMGLTGLPLMYPPYFSGNPNLAALIAGRGLFPNSEADLQALNAALKNQFNGMDLSLGSNGNESTNGVKQENNQDYRDDNELKINDNGELSDSESINNKSDETNENDNLNRNDDDNPLTALINANMMRSSRRKTSAPQWVNPDWQPSLLFKPTNGTLDDEMQEQAADFSKRSSTNNDDNNTNGRLSSDRLSQTRSPIPQLPTSNNTDISIKTESLDHKFNESDDEMGGEAVPDDSMEN